MGCNSRKDPEGNIQYARNSGNSKPSMGNSYGQVSRGSSSYDSRNPEYSN